jgi:hypothetical protein
MATIGRMRKLELKEIRDIWPNEEKDLSPWVANNIDLLNEILSLQIEIGGELIWEPLPERRACRIYKAIDGSIDDSNEKLNQMIEWAAPLMIKFRETFAPLVKNIQLEE